MMQKVVPSIAIFASGSGSNAENIVQYFRKTRTAKVGLIVCNNPEAGVIERAKRLRIPLVMMSKRAYNYPSLLLSTLQTEEIDFIVLAGFLWKISPEIIQAFEGKIVNIHPSLLPKFGGKGMYGNRVHTAVIDAGEQESGITIHHVNEHYDEGAVIFQAKSTVDSHDTADSLAEKIHALEFEHFPKIIEQLLTQP